MPARALPPRIDGDPIAELTQLIRNMSPAQLRLFIRRHRLDPDAVSLIEQIIAGEVATHWRADPARLAEHLDPTFRRWRYVDLLAGKFRDGILGKSKRQIWNLPARMGKSTLVGWGLVYALDRAPGARSIVVSYGDTLADELAIFVRDRLRMHSDVLRAELRRDRQRADRFVTSEGGGLLAAGINSAITGFGVTRGGVLAIDDPMKNWQEAHSEAARKRVADAYRGTLRNRLDDEDAFILVVHTRWHEDDLTAELSAASEAETGDRFEIISLPALAEPTDEQPDPLGRERGEPLEAEKFDVPQIRERHRALGSHVAAAVEQQRPAPEEGDELLRSWFRVESTLPPRFDQSLTSWDLKLKNREAGDFVVGQAWGRTGPDYWLVGQIRGQYDHATTANAIALLSVRHPQIRRHVVEAAGSADEVLPLLRRAQRGYVVTAEMAGRLGMSAEERAQVQAIRRRGMTGIVTFPPKGDKTVRARTHLAPPAEAGNVHLWASLPDLGPFLDEMASFPNGLHDDQVDAASQGLQRLSRAGGSARAASGRLERKAPPAPGQSTRPTGNVSVLAPRRPR